MGEANPLQQLLKAWLLPQRIELRRGFQLYAAFGAFTIRDLFQPRQRAFRFAQPQPQERHQPHARIHFSSFFQFEKLAPVPLLARRLPRLSQK